MKRIVFAFLALVMSCQLFAQNKLTGTILDGSMNNEPLIGQALSWKALVLEVFPTWMVISVLLCLRVRHVSRCLVWV